VSVFASQAREPADHDPPASTGSGIADRTGTGAAAQAHPKAQQAAILATALPGIEPGAWDRPHPRLDNQHHQR